MNKKAYINGKFIEGNDTFEIISPIDLKVAGTVPSLKEDDIHAAFNAARASFKPWRESSLKTRSNILTRFKKLLLNSKQELAEIMHKEIGKPVDESIVEIERTGEYIEQTIDAWDAIRVTEESDFGKDSTQIRVPLGVVLAISPFNYPVNLSLAKIAPALLVGNTVVFKAATNGSLTGAYIAELFEKAGVPAGVFNYVTGRGRDIGDILTAHKEIDMITFTGGVRVGKNIAKQSSMKPLVLELGGNDAAYIRNDADIELAVKEVVAGAFGYYGQRCTAIKRVIVHKDISEEFNSKLMAKVKELTMGPLITERAAKYVWELVEDSKNRGDKFLIEPSIEKNLVSQGVVVTTRDSRAWAEEAFGPLLPVVVTCCDEEAIEIMNDSNFGLQNSVFTKDIDWAMKIAPAIESGTFNINGKSSRGPDVFPFSGIKDSGFGVQGITPALESMTRIINVVKNL